jgi:hypothetical protein
MNFRNVVAAALCIASVGAAPGYVFAASCTQQDAMAKAQNLSQLLQAKMAQNPSAAQAVMAKMAPIAQSYSGQMTSATTINWDTICAEYDDLIKQAQ